MLLKCVALSWPPRLRNKNTLTDNVYKTNSWCEANQAM